MGGLGIRRTIPFNQALMGKWLWRFATENNAFWRQVIASKYGVEKGDWCTKEGRGGAWSLFMETYQIGVAALQ